MLRIPLLSLLILALVAGCGREPSGPDTGRYLVVDYEFSLGPEQEGALPQLFGHQATAHWFTGGWKGPATGGAWMRGTRSGFEFLAHGTECEVLIDVATDTRMARDGQILTVLCNGRELERIEVGDWENYQKKVFEIPADVLRNGRNELEFLATRVDDPDIAGEREVRPDYAVFFRRLQVSLKASPEQRDAMASAYESMGGDYPWSWTTTASSTTESVSSDLSRPDVLIVLLDAARRANFGCYGYPRDTTPFIDRLAAEGLVFDNVFTDVSFTRGAIPGLLTGHSWAHHRVVAAFGSLGPDFPTLAETLDDADYFTFAISSSPNASVAAGSHRGFDSFVEAWKEPGRQGRGAEFSGELVVERLEAGLPDRPVFCYLHLVPPHEPYVPQPQHDLWSDPDYDGMLENAGSDLGLLDQGKLPYEPSDLQQLIDLYDGHLRRGDAIVQSVVTAWNRQRPERDLLTVIVSDHGEAFAEHGRFGHSSTLYDEMTAIPLIFHPASLAPALAGTTSELRSITDIVPLLLRALDVPWMGTASVPVSFARLLEDPAWKRPSILMRTNTKFAVRTDRHLAVFDRWFGRELYDLAESPGALINVEAEQPALYETMVAQMRATELLAPDTVAESEELSPEDREALEALGYLGGAIDSRGP